MSNQTEKSNWNKERLALYGVYLVLFCIVISLMALFGDFNNFFSNTAGYVAVAFMAVPAFLVLPFLLVMTAGSFFGMPSGLSLLKNQTDQERPWSWDKFGYEILASFGYALAGLMIFGVFSLAKKCQG